MCCLNCCHHSTNSSGSSTMFFELSTQFKKHLFFANVFMLSFAYSILQFVCLNTKIKIVETKKTNLKLG